MKTALKMNSKTLKKIMKTIYENPNITHTELAKKINLSRSALTNNIARYSQHVPPLYKKEKQGRNCNYTITPAGEEFYNKELLGEESTIIDYQENISKEHKKALISYVLATADTSRNPYSAILCSLKMESITTNFTLNEFTILCQELQIIPNELSEPIIVKEKSTNLTIPIWERFKDLIVEDINQRRVKQIVKTSEKH